MQSIENSAVLESLANSHRLSDQAGKNKPPSLKNNCAFIDRSSPPTRPSSPDMRMRLVQMISTNSVRKLLNDFYMPAMGKIWDHFDPREINNLKSDSDKLKGKTQYQGK